MDELIQKFQTVAESEFSFLQDEYRFSRDIDKTATYVALCYRTSDVAVKLSFALRDHEIRVNCAPIAAENDYNMQLTNEDLLRLDLQEMSENSAFTVFNPVNMVDRIKELSFLLKKHGKPYLLGDEEAYCNLADAKSTLQKEHKIFMQMQEVREQLSKKWAQRDYAGVVLLLKPHLELLNQSEVRKYEYSLKRTS